MVHQEKFQISAPKNTNDNATDKWASVDSAQRKFPQNTLQVPPTFIDAPVTKANGGMSLVLGGSTDPTKSSEPEDLARGFDLHPMLMYDDQYTGEHQENFYEDVGGFCERSNYLDRL